MEITPPKDKAERDARLDEIIAQAERDSFDWQYRATYPIEVRIGKERFDDFNNVCDWLGVERRYESDFIRTGMLDDLRRIVSEIKQTPYTPAPTEG